jgi:hypothetical protein
MGLNAKPGDEEFHRPFPLLTDINFLKILPQLIIQKCLDIVTKPVTGVITLKIVSFTSFCTFSYCQLML